MDKLSYKQMLADEATKVLELENEINRLQILVAKYQDKENKLKKIVYDNSNNFELGRIVREIYNNERTDE